MLIAFTGSPGSERQFQCADCSADNPVWASLNRGVLICSECCYIHRNLGRHVSNLRSLQKGNWNKNQLELMYTLYANGSNSIWEHTLLDPLNSGKVKRKPQPHDPVIPVKESFIKEKYANSAFSLRPSKDEGPITQEDLDRQLWSCVRTSHIVTTLRLLALGADPNYADPEKHNAPLHIAAKEGQALQVELLWIYGADAGQVNASDLTPSQIAKLENHHELALRLEDLRFEVTDRFSMFLCNRKPDHSRNQDFLVPEMISEELFTSEVTALRRRLSVLPPHCFERIVQDVYDEVDRRETAVAWNAVMQSVQPINLSNEQWIAVFLPPNPEMTATRNQLRQKLAKCGAREFATLIVDILKEARRRDGLGRDYDDVAESNASTSRTSGSFSLSHKSEGQTEPAPVGGSVSLDDFLELKEKVLETEEKLSVAQQTNETLTKVLNRLQTDFERLSADNVEVRNVLTRLRDAYGYGELFTKRKSTSNVALSSTLPGTVQLMTRHASVGSPSTMTKQGLRYRFESDPAVDTAGYDDRYSKRKNVSEFGVNYQVFPDNLIVETERLTRAIKLLLSDAQFNRLALRAPDHAYAVAVQVDRIMAAVPKAKCTTEVTFCLKTITDATVKLSAKCNIPSVDVDETCNAAYDVAKAAKNLLVAVHER
ncbi:unnamed protein product [Enterobius vermicularis]|uniref:Arf-GAP domain-containing protein n=1 Tax=Enterobius vermicularis TaxID=51028 RepID=A0A0N4VM75_ENTVE|nr:unnamed protein product [Enterobius vermicularis]